MFDDINTAQWLWYFHNIEQDGLERFEANRDMVEYNSSFVAPEAVMKVREGREKAIKVSDADFKTILEQNFGRTIDVEKTKEEHKNSKVHALDPTTAMKGYRESLRKASGDTIELRRTASEFMNMNLG